LRLFQESKRAHVATGPSLNAALLLNATHAGRSTMAATDARTLQIFWTAPAHPLRLSLRKLTTTASKVNLKLDRAATEKLGVAGHARRFTHMNQQLIREQASRASKPDPDGNTRPALMLVERIAS
jgi:hypothetical protein